MQGCTEPPSRLLTSGFRISRFGDPEPETLPDTEYRTIYLGDNLSSVVICDSGEALPERKEKSVMTGNRFGTAATADAYPRPGLCVEQMIAAVRILRMELDIPQVSSLSVGPMEVGISESRIDNNLPVAVDQSVSAVLCRSNAEDGKTVTNLSETGNMGRIQNHLTMCRCGPSPD